MTPNRRTMPEQPDIAAILRYVSGQSPLPESEVIRSWLALNPRRQATIEELRSAWLSQTQVPTWDKIGVWNRLTTELANPSEEHIVNAGRVTRQPAMKHSARSSLAHRFGWESLAIAAGITLLVGAGAAPIWRHSTVSTNESIAMREVATARGQQAVLDLADGSRVTLAPESKLRIPSDFDKPGRNGRRRELELQGRAYFNVWHDPTRPFVVHTATARTVDVGTSFVISAYPETRTTRVVVVDGSVSLWQPSGKQAASQIQNAPLMMLTRGDVATLDVNGSATRTRNVSLSADTSWMNGVLTFDRTPLSDVIRELDRWFDVDVRLSDTAMQHRHVTAEIRTETAGEAMRRIGLLLGADVRQSGRLITLVPRGDNSQRILR
jgi:transmembrane sensor